jgi:Protein of unknown function (DUF1566)
MSNHAGVAIVTLAVAVMTIGSSFAGGDPAVSCRVTKLKEAGKYQACLLGAAAKAVKAGGPADTSTCDQTFAKKWLAAEVKAGAGVCQTEGDESPLGGFITTDSAAVADELAGGSLSAGAMPVCASPSAPPRTSQIVCYGAGSPLSSCAATGQDGELQKGVARRFVDNGDGTITDETTGLMWEKLTDDGSVHDKDDRYNTLTQAITLKIGSLNSAQFSGYADWRLPNIKELQTLQDYGDPSGVYSAFNRNCSPCTVSTCSCTALDGGSAAPYWSSTTNVADPGKVWVLSRGMYSNFRADGSPPFRAHVRAVRGGA